MMLIILIFGNTIICLEKIGANLNQIAKRVNETRSIYQSDMDEIKGEMEKLWKVQKAMLKKQPVMSQ